MSSDKRKTDSLDRLRFQRMNPDELKKRFPFKHFLSDNSVFRYRFDSLCSAIFASSPSSPTNVTKPAQNKKSLSEALSSAISRHSSKRKLISNDIHSGANHSLDTNQIGRSIDSLFTSSPVNSQKNLVGNGHRYFKKLRSTSDSEKKNSTKALLLSGRKTGCHSTLSSPTTIASTGITPKNAPLIRTTNSFAHRHLNHLKSAKYNVQQESTESRKDNEPIFIYTLRKPSKAHIIDANITKSDYFYKFFGDYVPRLSEENESEEECAGVEEEEEEEEEELNKEADELGEARPYSTNSNERFGKQQIRARVKNNLRISKNFQKKLLNNQLIELNSNKMGQKYSNYHSLSNMNNSSSQLQSHHYNHHHHRERYRHDQFNDNNLHALHHHHYQENSDEREHNRLLNYSIPSERYRQHHQQSAYRHMRRSLDNELSGSNPKMGNDEDWSDKRLKCFQYNYCDNYKTKSLVIEDDDDELDEIFSSYRRVSASMGSLGKEKTSSELTLLDMKLMEKKCTSKELKEVDERSKHTNYYEEEQLNNNFNYSSNPISDSVDNKELPHNVTMATGNKYIDTSNLSIPSIENRQRRRIDIIPPQPTKLSMTLGQSSLSIGRRTSSECNKMASDKQQELGDVKVEMRKRKMSKQNFWRMSMNKNINSIDYHLREEENMHEFGTKSTPISPKNFEAKDVEGEFKFKTYSTNINSRIGSSNALMSTTNFYSTENDKANNQVNSTISHFPNTNRPVSIFIPSTSRSKSTTISTAQISSMTSLKTPPPTTNSNNNNNTTNNNSSTITSAATINSLTGNRLNRFKQTFAQKRFSFMKTYSNRLSDTSIDSMIANDDIIVRYLKNYDMNLNKGSASVGDVD